MSQVRGPPGGILAVVVDVGVQAGRQEEPCGPVQRLRAERLLPDLTEGDQPIPAEGAVNEAVEIAKKFCGAESPGFVNGILGAVLADRA